MNKKYLLLLLVLPFFPSCDNESSDDDKPKIVPPLMLISAATYVGTLDAVLNGEIRVLGTKPVTDHGFIYSVNPITSINDGQKISLGAGTIIEKITARVTNLTKQTKYFVKAFATNEDTSVLSDEITFTTGKTNEWVPSVTYTVNDLGGGLVSQPGFVVNGKGYVSCGYHKLNDNYIVPLYEFDPATYTNSIIQTCPAPLRYDVTSFALGDTIYIAGGYRSDQRYKDIWKYNAVAKTWKQGKDLPGSPYNTRAYSLNGKAYLVASDINSNITHLVYSTASGSWLEIKKPTDPIHYVRCVFSSGGFGYSVITYSDKSFVLKYDPVSDGWTKLAQIPFSVTSNAFVLTTANKGYLLQPDGCCSSQVWEYNIQNDTWSSKAAAPSAFQAGYVLENTIYALDSGEKLYSYVPE